MPICQMCYGNKPIRAYRVHMNELVARVVSCRGCQYQVEKALNFVMTVAGKEYGFQVGLLEGGEEEEESPRGGGRVIDPEQFAAEEERAAALATIPGTQQGNNPAEEATRKAAQRRSRSSRPKNTPEP